MGFFNKISFGPDSLPFFPFGFVGGHACVVHVQLKEIWFSLLDPFQANGWLVDTFSSLHLCHKERAHIVVVVRSHKNTGWWDSQRLFASMTTSKVCALLPKNTHHTKQKELGIKEGELWDTEWCPIFLKRNLQNVVLVRCVALSEWNQLPSQMKSPPPPNGI